MFGTLENLKAFASLRLKYMLWALKEVVAARVIEGVNDVKKEFLLGLGGLAYDSKEFDILVVFDSVQFCQLWAKEWASVLLRANDLKELCQIVTNMDHIVTVAPQPDDFPTDPNAFAKMKLKMSKVQC